MGTYNIIIDTIDDVEELSAILNTHDNTGDVDADTFVRAAAVCAALAFVNSKVQDKDRKDFNPEDFKAQTKRIDDMVDEYYDLESYSVVRTSLDLFIANLATSLISAISDQSHTPIFSRIKDDLSLVFKVMDGKDETEDSNRMSADT